MAADTHSEVERKYDVAPGARVPDLGVLPGVGRVAAPVEVKQTATYVDTPDLRLLRAGVTLRRRTGGVDDGWHLKGPRDGDRREEVHVPLGESEGPPPELVDRVRGLVRDTVLEPSAVLVTRRSIHRLLDADGAVLAELCDDRVTATRAREAGGQEWREWEVELVDGSVDLLDAAEAVLREAGARPSGAASKVARVLAADLPSPAPPAPEGSAGALLVGYVATQVARLQREDLRLRSGDAEGVHQLRVAARRIRSVLGTYAPLLAPGSVTALRAELRWFGQVLSQARDAQVLGQRLVALVAELPPSLVVGPVAERLSAELDEAFRVGRRHGDEVLDGARYFRLLDALEAFVAAPPFLLRAQVAAREVVPDLLEADRRRLLRRARAHRRATAPEERQVALHDVRKAAKRLRYAAESVEPVFGKRATTVAARAEALQELLGEHQDSVVSRETLRAVADRAHAAGEPGFTYGLLHAAEARRAAEVEERYPKVLGRLPRQRLR